MSLNTSLQWMFVDPVEAAPLTSSKLKIAQHHLGLCRNRGLQSSSSFKTFPLPCSVLRLVHRVTCRPHHAHSAATPSAASRHTNPPCCEAVRTMQTVRMDARQMPQWTPQARSLMTTFFIKNQDDRWHTLASNVHQIFQTIHKGAINKMPINLYY